MPFVDSVTNLGVIMDSKLTWKQQVDAISRKVNRALYGLRSFQSCTTEALRKQLASALVISHLNYCSIVYLDVSEELHKRLQRLQNASVRYVCGVRRSEHISPYRRKLDWLDVKVMCNPNFNIFLNQDSNIYLEKDGCQALRTRKHYMQIFFWMILLVFS